MQRCFFLVIVAALLAPNIGAANSTPELLYFNQPWTDTWRTYYNDDWSYVPGVVGFLGQDLTTTPGEDPQLLVGESTLPNDVDLMAAQTAPNSLSTGGVASFYLTDPVVALQGSSIADAPNLVIAVRTTGRKGIHVSYALRDIDGSTDDAVTPVALQYRIGTTGPFTNLPAAFVADATDGPSLATKVTNVAVTLPTAADDQPNVQLRIITANAVGANEWVGVDNITVTNDYFTFSAYCTVGGVTSVASGTTTFLAVVVQPDGSPPSTGITATCDMTEVGGSATQTMYDDGTHGDLTPNNYAFEFEAPFVATTRGTKTMYCTARDAENRSFACSASIYVSVCGDGFDAAAFSTQVCDDGNLVAGDGCSPTCKVEPGWACSGEPSVCGDYDECADFYDNGCTFPNYCTNTVGSYTCTCPAGYTGDGYKAGTGCTDVDECTLDADDCVDLATCRNTGGSFTCRCPNGYSGDGRLSGTGCTEIDECATGDAFCHSLATCTNTPGSYICTCPPGFSGDGYGLSGCNDIHECSENLDDCSPDATCTDTYGSFTCTCLAGFTGDGRTCVDVDECATNADDCATEASCTNTFGGFTCTCRPGYTGDGHTCSDIDECTSGTHDCAAQATCTNSSGTFSCACLPGYAGDGHTCSDLDECADNVDDCSPNAVCTNTPGSFSCMCVTGYVGDGRLCFDFDECGAGTAHCPANTRCVNTPGSFSCTRLDIDAGIDMPDAGDGSPTDNGGCCSSTTSPEGPLTLSLLTLLAARRRRRQNLSHR